MKIGVDVYSRADRLVGLAKQQRPDELLQVGKRVERTYFVNELTRNPRIDRRQAPASFDEDIEVTAADPVSVAAPP